MHGSNRTAKVIHARPRAWPVVSQVARANPRPVRPWLRSDGEWRRQFSCRGCREESAVAQHFFVRQERLRTIRVAKPKHVHMPHDYPPQSTRHLPREFRMPTNLSRFPVKQQHVTYEGRIGLHDHWVGHAREFPEYRNARDYLCGAIEFCRSGTTHRFYYRRYGRPHIGYFNRETGTYAATSVDGETSLTYFRPGPQNIDAEVRRWRMPENENHQRTMPPGITPKHSTPLRQP